MLLKHRRNVHFRFLAASLLGLLLQRCSTGTVAPKVEPESFQEAPAQPELGYLPSQIIVKMKSDPRASDQQVATQSLALMAELSTTHHLTGARTLMGRSLLTANGAAASAAEVASALASGQTYILNTESEANIETLANIIASDSRVEFAQPNYKVEAYTVPNDPYFSSQGAWGQNYDDLWGIKRVNAPAAWDLSLGDGVVVAVVDTGVDYTHPDLNSNIWDNPGEIPGNQVDDDSNGLVDDVHGWNFIENNNEPIDRHGHGTHVAGTIAAVGNNAIGVVGVAPKAKIMAVQGLSAAGSGSVSVLAAGIVYAAKNGAKVINNSWGCGWPCPVNPVVEDAVKQATALGAVVVFAAGNSASNIKKLSPQNLPEVVLVAASSQLDTQASFSNFGEVDVAAPGGDNTDNSAGKIYSNILSTRAAGTSMNGYTELIVNDQYFRARGTSMAAPHVAGVVALIRSRFPQLSVEQVRQSLRKGSRDVPPSGFDPATGYGIVDAAASLQTSQPLEVLITSPTTLTPLGTSTITATGRVGGPNLKSWVLEAGKLKDGAMTYTPVASGTSAVNGTLGSQLLDDGEYTLRLQATQTNGTVFEDRQETVVDTIDVLYPPVLPTAFDSTVLRIGEPITITGSADPKTFISYRLEATSVGAIVSPSHFALTNGGNSPVTRNTLGTFDTTGLSPGPYAVTLIVHIQDAEFRETREIVLVDTAAGFPIDLRKESQSQLFDTFAVVDIDNNKVTDIVFAFGNQVHVSDGHGQSLSGWPQPLLADDANVLSLAVGDLDGDGTSEIVAATQKNIYLFSNTGSRLMTWPLTSTETYVAIADIDGDGVKDAVIHEGTSLNVTNINGQSKPGWPKSLGNVVNRGSPPAIGDVDGDGKREIAIESQRADKTSQLSLYDSTGTLMSGWPKVSAVKTDFWRPRPVMADIDNDHSLDIITTTADGTVYVFDKSGNNVSGWPHRLLDTDGSPTNSSFVSPVTPGDLDGDGTFELVVGVLEVNPRKNLLHVLKNTGTRLSGWPVEAPLEKAGWARHIYYGYLSATIADITGDGQAEIIVSSDSPHYKGATPALHAYQLNGTELAGFPKITSTGSYNVKGNALVSDFNGDGSLELVTGDAMGHLFMWNLPAPATSRMPWPAPGRNAQRTSSYEVTAIAAPTITLSVSPSTGTKEDTYRADWSVLNGTSCTLFYDAAEVGKVSCASGSQSTSKPPWGKHIVTVQATNSAGSSTRSKSFVSTPTCNVSLSSSSGSLSSNVPFTATWSSDAPSCTWDKDSKPQGALGCSGSATLKPSDFGTTGIHGVSLTAIVPNTVSSTCTSSSYTVSP